MMRAKCSGAKRGMPLNSRSPSSRERVADAQRAAVDHADHVARPRLLDRAALARQELLRRREAHRSSRVRTCFTCIPASKRPEQTRTNATRSRCLRVHVRLDLEHEAGERRRVGSTMPVVDSRGDGARRELEELVEERLDAEVRERAAEEHRRELAASAPPASIERVARRVEQRDVLHEPVVRVVAEQLARARDRRGADAAPPRTRAP